MLPPNTILLAGPTAVGKSDLAVALAERVGGEIVGADAFQIYAGLDTLSAKPSAELRARVPHHLVGVIPLSESFDVAKYATLAHTCIADIAARGRVPVVCGGTGLYLRALTHGLAELPGADPALRARLETETLDALVARYRELDPAGAGRMDLNNPRRVIRGLEVCLLTGRPFSEFRAEWDKAGAPVHGFVITRPREELNARIAERTRRMFEHKVIQEVLAITDISPTASQMLGLREIQAFLAGRMSREDCQIALEQGTRQYAKRQVTWFKREATYPWLDLSIEADPIGWLLSRLGQW